MSEEQKRGPGRPPKKEMVSVEVLRDYWPSDNELDRVRKGTVVEMEPMDAIDLIEQRRVRRVK